MFAVFTESVRAFSGFLVDCVGWQNIKHDQKNMDKFTQMKIMLTALLWITLEWTRIYICHYLASRIENLLGRYFQTFHNETVKLLSVTQSRAEENHSNLHFPGAPVPFPHMCTRLISSSHKNQQPLPGYRSLLFQQLRYQQASSYNQFNKELV